ncbi:MAG: hypothetical protein ACJKSS_03240 [Patescibacteria group bacterium UBA2103]
MFKQITFIAVMMILFAMIGATYLALGNYLIVGAGAAHDPAFERFTFLGALYVIAYCASMGVGLLISATFKKRRDRDNNPGEVVMATTIIQMVIFFVGLALMGAMALEMTEQSIIAGVGAMMISNVLVVRFSFEGGKQIATA